jgi:hypothetical protein
MVPIAAPFVEPPSLPGMLLSDSRDGSSRHDKDPVVTPGGPRPGDQVHPVKPGQTVRQNPDGTFTVIPEEAPADPDRKDEKK